MPKTPNRRLTYKERIRINTLHEIGWKQKDIAQKLGIPASTVSLCLRTPETPTKPKGRSPILSTPFRILLVRHATENAEQRRKTREEIAQELGITVCRRSLIKAFEKELYHRRKATEKPFLTDQHKADRVKWAWEHLDWTDDQWAGIGWSDDMSAQAGPGEVWVTRRAEERFLPACCVARFKGYSSCMVWAMISRDMKGPLVVYEKSWCTNQKHSVDSKVYIEHILPLIMAFRDAYTAYTGKQLTLMEDNASIHTSKATKEAEEALGIPKIWWPANSPDLNPIENVWQILKYRLGKRFPKTDSEVRQYLLEEWEKLSFSDYSKYIKSIRERCWAVIKAEGGHTKW